MDESLEGRVGMEFGFGIADGLSSGRSSKRDAVDLGDCVGLNSQGVRGRVVGRGERDRSTGRGVAFDGQGDDFE